MRIAKKLGGAVQPNSGATAVRKGDVVVPESSMLIECKTSMKNKETFSVKRTVLDGIENEAFAMGNHGWALAFDFGPDTPTHYVVSEAMFMELLEHLREGQ
jgi:hypothetical protein